jgi:hypothetical protein
VRSIIPADAGVDPATPLAELIHLLTRSTVAVAAGVGFGLVSARAMRRLHLHWSWAAVVVAVVAVARPVSTPAVATVFLATSTAAVCGRRWHREDLAAGLDLAESASRRFGPLELLGAVWMRALARLRDLSPASGTPLAGELELGADEHGRPARIAVVGGGGGRHTLITGATGSGKTVTQASIATHAISTGLGAIVIDPKGDQHMRAALSNVAASCGRRFVEWTPAGPSVYNPYARGSDTEIADKVLASERFTEPHYQRQAQRYLGHVVRALREAGVPTSLRTIAEHLDPAALELLVRSLPDADHATHHYLDSLTARQQSDLGGVRDRLAILAESDVGRWLDPDAATNAQFDLLDAVRDRAVVYFALEADSRPLLAQMLGGAVVQDLQTVVAAMQGRAVPTVVVIDEFSSLGAAHVVRLFGRARSAGVSLLLGTQELADLRVPGHERLLEQVLGNLSVLIAHRQVVPDSAALIARMSGARGAWRTSLHSDGRLTRTRVAEPILSPERLSRLQPGWAAVVELERAAGARIVRVRSGGAR